jgi:hypothetical protein
MAKNKKTEEEVPATLAFVPPVDNPPADIFKPKEGEKSATDRFLPEGTYKATILGNDFDTTPTGTELYRLPLKLTAVEDPDERWKFTDLKSPARRDLSLWLNSTANTERAIQTLRHIGFDSEDITALDPDSENAYVFKGKEILVTVKHGVYKDKPQENINYLRRKGQQTPEGRAAVKQNLGVTFAELMRNQKQKGG